MKLRLLVPVLGLLVLAGLTLVTVLFMQSPAEQVASQTRTIQEWQDAFIACGNGVMTDAVLSTPEAEECIYEVMTSSADVNQLVEMQEALSAQILLTPPLFNACHNAGHNAGQYAYALSGDIADLLLTNTSTTCQYGVGHGLLDGFAKSEPSDEEYQAAADACVELLRRNHHDSFAFCTDGLGHAAWASTKDIDRAVARCAMISESEGRAACAEGIIMQVYEPAGFLPSEDIAKAPEQLPSMCAAWPSSDPDLRAGCDSGAGYIYTRPAWVREAAWRNENSDGSISGEDAKGMLEDMKWAAKMCRQHEKGAGRNFCLKSLSQQTPHSVYTNETLLRQVCDTQGQWANRCFTWKHTLK